MYEEAPKGTYFVKRKSRMTAQTTLLDLYVGHTSRGYN